jgi:ABC-type multidrug transport system fused ATPase/permease subunit
MPWCPVCKNEYREGYTHCNDCDVDLVDSLEEGPRALIAGAEYDMNRMAELLQAKDVECFVRPGQRKDEFELYVTEEHAERATAYLQSYVQAMMQQQEKERRAAMGMDVDAEDGVDTETPEEQQAPERAALYEDKNNKAEDAKSSAIALLLVGGLGLVFIVLLMLDYLPIHLFGLGKYLVSAIMAAMFLVFIAMGFSSIKTYKKYLGIAEEEQKNIEQIMDLLAQHMSKEVIDTKLAGEPEEMPQIYYSRLALIKEFLETHYGGLEPALLEKLADDWYEELYGESDEELLSEEADEESVEESSEEDEETAENEE